ncbi:MAG: hypothetical protein JOZ80_10360 [Acidobacteriaceae bacterium]|nr:hypothetical protein [Acidobacteriaceae bacterium]
MLLPKVQLSRQVVLFLAAGIGFAQILFAQEQPQVKLNVLNVCSPSPEEQQEIASALARIPQKAAFNQDFEIDRGRSIPDQSANMLAGGLGEQLPSDAGPADWVRIRREFVPSSPFASVQYSFSRDAKSMVETLVFRIREPKDVMQIALEDSASAVTPPASMLSADTPSSRMKLERFGKSSVVLARCSGSETSPAPDQSAYEPLFHSASAIVANYRNLLAVRRTVPEELTRISMISGNGRKLAKTSPKDAAQKRPQ